MNERKNHAGQFECLKIAMLTHAKWNGNSAHICNITLPNATKVVATEDEMKVKLWMEYDYTHIKKFVVGVCAWCSK